MRRTLNAVFLIFFALGVGSCSAQAGKPENLAEVVYATALTRAQPALKAGDYSSAVDALVSVAKGPWYAKLSDERRHELDNLIGYAASRSFRGRDGREAMIRATNSRLATHEDWFLLMETAKLDTDFQTAFRAFEVLAREAPGFETDLEDETISVLEHGFGTLANGDEAQFKFEDYLAGRDWRPVDPLFSPDVIGFHRAVHLLAHGAKADAATVVAGFTEPEVVALVGVDKRFDTLVAGHPEWTDVAAANARRLAKFEALQASDPGKLYLRTAVTGHRWTMGDRDKALEALDKAIADAERHPSLTPADDYNHALVQRSAILFDLGRTEEALTQALAIGVRAPPRQPLMPAEWFVELERGAEALDLLKDVTNDELQLQAQAGLARLRTCAAGQIGADAVQRENLAYLRSHPRSAPVENLRALLCMGDLEGAAAEARAALADPRMRPLVLDFFQDGLPPRGRTPFGQRIEMRRVALRERPDVQAAIKAVGRINRQPMIMLGVY